MNHPRLEVDKRADKKIFILGVGVSSTSLSRVLTILNTQYSILNRNRPFFIVTVNPEFVMLAQQDREFKKILNSADLAIPDGVGLRLARPGLAIVPGRRLVEELVSNQSKSKYKIFFLGGRGDVARRMAQKYGGAYDPGSPDIKSEILNSKIQINSNNQILNKINSFKPDILLVAYGAPWQERWLWANRYQLKAKVVMGVGGAFDYLVGDVQLPLKIVERYGLEWLWRLVHQPWRWRRQLRLLQFVWLVLSDKLRGGGQP